MQCKVLKRILKWKPNTWHRLIDHRSSMFLPMTFSPPHNTALYPWKDVCSVTRLHRFSLAALCTWICLPTKIHSADLISCFRFRTKTHFIWVFGSVDVVRLQTLTDWRPTVPLYLYHFPNSLPLLLLFVVYQILNSLEQGPLYVMFSVQRHVRSCIYAQRKPSCLAFKGSDQNQPW